MQHSLEQDRALTGHRLPTTAAYDVRPRMRHFGPVSGGGSKAGGLGFGTFFSSGSRATGAVRDTPYAADCWTVLPGDRSPSLQ